MDNSSSSAEVKELISGPLFSQIVGNVSQRLGFPNSLSFGIKRFPISLENKFISR